jgi:hypothetical protein
MKILYFNQQAWMSNPNLFSQLDPDNRLFQAHMPDILEIATGRQKWDPGTHSLYSRKGKDNLFFSSDLKNMPGFCMPDYDKTFSKSWATIMDDRCKSLHKSKFDKSWLVSWSGGIDSTGIVAAIIRNIPKSDWGNITVACNQMSVRENPRFFIKHIQPNFTVVDSAETLFSAANNQSVYVIDGEPADQLFAGGNGQTLTNCFGLEYMEKDAVRDADVFINFVAGHGRIPGNPPGKTFAEWFYSRLIDNAQSVDVPINTFHDLLWWSYFNFSWIGVKLRVLEQGNWGKSTTASAYLERFIHWFDDDNFQHWAMHNNNLEKYGESIGDYKKAAKQYIFEFDNNKYYLKYKSKTNSGNYRMPCDEPWVGITDELTILRPSQDLELIKELLPLHLNSFKR